MSTQPKEKECPTCETRFLASKDSHGRSDDGFRTYCSVKCVVESLRSGSALNCANCGKEFWVQKSRQARRRACCSLKCRSEYHTAERTTGWRGGTCTKKQSGVKSLYFPRERYVTKYVGEHRLVAAKAVGRLLEPYEIVLRINRNPKNSAPNNLFICGTVGESMSRINALGSLPYPTQSNLKTYR